ncbi:MAG: VOC family protein [Ginsengibacter sp.]
MSTKIFVNLPVKDLGKTMEFFTKLGYAFNSQFTDEKAACMVISEDIFAMLLVEEYFKTFIKKEVADASKTTEVITCLSADSRQQVDDLVKKAVEAGGTVYKEPQDHGFMYGHGFQDLDGHLWEIMWMDPAAVNQSN